MAAAEEAEAPPRHRLPPQVILLRGLILACFRWDFVECGFDGGILGILAVVVAGLFMVGLPLGNLFGMLGSIS